jgi:hypothetical protein
MITLFSYHIVYRKPNPIQVINNDVINCDVIIIDYLIAQQKNAQTKRPSIMRMTDGRQKPVSEERGAQTGYMSATPLPIAAVPIPLSQLCVPAASRL